MHNARQTVEHIYQAFGRGDVPAILETLSADVQWDVWADHSAHRAGVPHLAPRHGPDEVMGFFQALRDFQIHGFQVLDIVGDGRQVAAEVQIDATITSTGRRLTDEELHLWTFGDDGKVTRFRHYVDTAKHILAAGRTLPT